MIEITLAEWEKRVLTTKQYKVVKIEYSKKSVTVYDYYSGNFYTAIYNLETNMMELRLVIL